MDTLYTAKVHFAQPNAGSAYVGGGGMRPRSLCLYQVAYSTLVHQTIEVR